MDEDLAERMSAIRRPGETDMDYFERRYQERVRICLFVPKKNVDSFYMNAKNQCPYYLYL